MNFVPHTQEEKDQIMEFLKITSISELFDDIEDTIRIKNPLALPKPLSEMEIITHMREMAGLNANVIGYACFLGAGAYNHFIPSVVEHMVSRGEFYTSYTPYQAEMSQGMLQSIFEFQTMICELTKMDVANASMYDGANAMSEAAIMAAKYTERDCVAVSKAVHPEYRQVLHTYANAFGIDVMEVDIKDGLTDINDMESKVNQKTACVIVQSPNFFGSIENMTEIAEFTHRNGGIFVSAVVDPISLGILKPPGEYGADVVVGEAQSLGNSLNYGGPHVGFMATKNEFLKKIPGRISGLTVDTNGERGFILTLQAREQHVRRERATSNICTNQALNALAATIYLALMGKNGLKRIAEICAQRAHYASSKISEIKGFERAFNAPFFHEFTIHCPISPEKINRTLLKRNIIGGLDLGRFFGEYKSDILFCVTEMNPKESIDELVNALGEVTQ
ncbi:MAG: aminomethyl-transferring glycine dehydrogenase subunit GcvPA [Thermoplasmata archaeon]|nr:MAG: aminomethyl-transferring glycine dehydrogenase subunit GcvPA [Thermoplasmata archaeon]